MKVFNRSNIRWNLWDLEIPCSLAPNAVSIIPGNKEELVQKSETLNVLLRKGTVIEVADVDEIDNKKVVEKTLEDLKKKGVKAVFVEALPVNEVPQPTVSFKKDVNVDFVEEEERILQKTEDNQYIVEAKDEVNITQSSQCQGITAQGEPCKKKAVKGYDYCIMHMPEDLKQKMKGN